MNATVVVLVTLKPTFFVNSLMQVQTNVFSAVLLFTSSGIHCKWAQQSATELEDGFPRL